MNRTPAENQEIIKLIATLTTQRNQEKENADRQIEQLYASLIENETLEDELADLLPQSNAHKTILKEKDNIIQEKQKQLIELQSLLIQKMKSKSVKKTEETHSFEPIPIVTNKIQFLLSKLSEQSIDEKRTEVPIKSILKVILALDQLYQQCIDYKFINETEEMKKQKAQENNQFQALLH